MKQILIITLVIISFATIVTAQNVEQFSIGGKTYYGTKAIPGEIIGLYQYEKVKEPIVRINSNGTGVFQHRDVNAYPVEFWIQTDENGTIQKRNSQVNNNYQVVLIFKYGSNGESGWQGELAGTYDMIDVAMAFDLGFAIILGERYRKL